MQWEQMETMKRVGAVLLVGAVGVGVAMAVQVVPVISVVPVGLAVGGLAVAVLGSLLQMHRIWSINTGSAEALHRRISRE